MAERAPSYNELVEQVSFLANQVAALKRDNIFIRREAATSAPTELGPGAVQMVDTGSEQGIYWNSPSGIRSVPLT